MPSRRTPDKASADIVWELLDLWIVVVLVSLTAVLVFYLDPGVLPTVTLLLALLFVFLLPGYALIAALQPRGPRERHSAERDRYEPTVSPEEGMAVTERLILAAGMSVGLVTATVFVLHATGVGIEAESASVVLAGITLVGCVVAAVRRYRVNPESRFDGGKEIRSLATVRGLFVRRSTIDLAITSLIVVSLVVAVAGATYIAVSVDDRQSYTELSVLSTNESGEPVAAEYPSDEEGSDDLLIEVTNQEGETMNYTLVIQHQRVDGDVVTKSGERDRFRIELSRDGEWSREYHVPTDDNLAGKRVMFLLYVDSPPDDPNRENAYRAVHVWLDAPDDAA